MTIQYPPQLLHARASYTPLRGRSQLRVESSPEFSLRNYYHIGLIDVPIEAESLVPTPATITDSARSGPFLLCFAITRLDNDSR